MITLIEASRAIYAAWAHRIRFNCVSGPNAEAAGPKLVMFHYPDGRTEWRDDQGATGLFRVGVGKRSYPPHNLFIDNYSFFAEESLRRLDKALDRSKYHITFHVRKEKKG